MRSDATSVWITVAWWLLGAAGLVVNWVFSGWKAAVIFAMVYLAVFIPGRLLLRRRQRQ